ncbi:hypothetical protein [Oceanihabitans sediminis]|uniref:hypothetical protein n=1 Tax=Oceanihabitans sediminis TaxID=1812012 RepID=UPI00299EBE1C|nr:hypothetical protein [Oceanihabitans sediminis]MDX1279354.1 hypothetical protein [Oceanihabitans sediminis]
MEYKVGDIVLFKRDLRRDGSERLITDLIPELREVLVDKIPLKIVRTDKSNGFYWIQVQRTDSHRLDDDHWFNHAELEYEKIENWRGKF